MISVCIGGFIGAMTRYYLSKQIEKITHVSFPIATFIINLIGCFLIGVILNFDFSQSVYLLIAIGFLGAFTTISTFAVEVIQLIEKKNYVVALIYVLSSGIIGISCTIIGLKII